MGCGSSSTKEEYKNNKISSKNNSKKTLIKNSSTNLKTNYESLVVRSKINTNLDPPETNEYFYLILFHIKILDTTTIEIVGESGYKIKLVPESKMNIFEYIKKLKKKKLDDVEDISDNNKNSSNNNNNNITKNNIDINNQLNNLEEDKLLNKDNQIKRYTINSSNFKKNKLEFMLYCFVYKSGRKIILNYFDIDDVLISSPQKNDSLIFVWLIDFLNIDIDVESIIPTLRDFDDINEVIIQCEYIGPQFITQEPDINDDGYVDDVEAVGSSGIEIQNEITKDEISNSLEKELDENLITQITLKKNRFPNPDVLIIFLDIVKKKAAKDITFFNFSENLNIKDNWIKVIDCIDSMNNLHHLNLSMGFIYDKYIIYLFNALKNKRILSIDLSSNFITTQGAAIISKWLSFNRTLKEIQLQQNTMNEFKKEGVGHICNSLINHPNIEYIDVSYMVLTGLGNSLANLLKKTKTLKILKIKNIRMNYNDYVALMPTIGNNNTLKELYMNDNNPMRDEAVDIVAKMIATNKSLEILNIDSFGLNLENSKVFFVYLKKNNTINDISLNNHPEITTKKYLDMMKNCNTIKKLSIINRNNKYKKSKEEIDQIENYKQANNVEIYY